MLNSTKSRGLGWGEGREEGVGRMCFSNITVNQPLIVTALILRLPRILAPWCNPYWTWKPGEREGGGRSCRSRLAAAGGPGSKERGPYGPRGPDALSAAPGQPRPRRLRAPRGQGQPRSRVAAPVGATMRPCWAAGLFSLVGGGRFLPVFLPSCWFSATKTAQLRKRFGLTSSLPSWEPRGSYKVRVFVCWWLYRRDLPASQFLVSS